MDLQMLKQKIVDKTIDNTSIIFVYTDNTFLIHQYIDALAKTLNKNIEYVSKLETELSIFETERNYLQVLFEDKLVDDKLPLTDTIIVCKSIKDELKIKYEKFIVEMPKLETWQLNDYVMCKCQGLSNDIADYLTTTCKDVFRLDNELEKISLFPKDSQLEAFKELQQNGNFNDIDLSNIFTIATALIKKEVDNVADYTTIEPFALIGVLISNLRKIIDVVFGKNSADSLKISQKQYNAIYYSYKNISAKRISYLLNFLSNIDSLVKSGELQLTDKKLVDYIVVNCLK